VSYIVKWKKRSGELIQSPIRYSTVSEAQAFASALSDQEVAEIWIEDEFGTRFTTSAERR